MPDQHQDQTDRSQQQPAAVSMDVVMSCLDLPPGTTGTVEVTMSYDVRDPYAVALVFHTGEVEVTWLVGRELLLSGASAPAGEGDVAVWPALSPDLLPAVAIRLQSPSGRLVLRISAAELGDFLWRTLGLVPLGTETDWVDVDALAASLLAS